MNTNAIPRREIKSAERDTGADEIKAALEELTATTTTAIQEMRQELEDADDRERKRVRELNEWVARQTRPRFQSKDGGGFPNASQLSDERKALGVFAKSGDEAELKAMSTDSDPAGGFFVLSEMSGTMTKRIFDQNPVRRLARVVTLQSGDAWDEPLDMDDAGAQWVSERQARSSTKTAALAMLHVPLNEIWAEQPITQKLLDTGYVDIGQWIEGKLADKFARTEGVAFVMGSGALQPQGFLNLATSNLGDSASRPANTLQYVPTGSAASITADSLKDLYWTLRAPHRANGTWLMASATANLVDKLKDAQGDYLWRNGMSAGAPPSLLGRPVEFCEDLPAVAANAFPIAFGDWQKGYVIIDRLGLRLVRDPFTSKPNVLFDAFKRVGGGVANTDAIKLLKIATS